MQIKPFWTKGTIIFLVFFATGAMVVDYGLAGAAELYVTILGMFVTYKILAKEKL